MKKTVFERCKDLNPEDIQRLISAAGGAVYLNCVDALQENIERFSSSLRSEYFRSRIAYSLKTNYYGPYVKAAYSAGTMIEVVSIDEFQFAEKMGVKYKDIIVNGPGKSIEDLAVILQYEITLIADSISELKKITLLMAGGLTIRAKIGVRINPRLEFQAGDSRFGVDFFDSDQVSLLKKYIDEGLNLAGVHLHITDSRSSESFQDRLDFLFDQWNSLKIGKPEFMDIGGGFASSMPEEMKIQLAYSTVSLEKYGYVIGKKMKKYFPDCDVDLYCEPGTGILADASVFITPVLDTKIIGDKSYAVVDGTQFTVNPLRSTSNPAIFHISRFGGNGVVGPPVTIVGNSCMDIDVFHGDFSEVLQIDDILIFAQKGAYAACMASPFIQGIPASALLNEDNSIELDRSRTDYSLLKLLNT